MRYIVKDHLGVIVSAEKAGLGERENLYRTEELSLILSDLGIEHKPIRGCYNGAIEDSYYCVCEDSKALERIKELAARFSQDCILIRDTRTDECKLWFDNKKVKPIGRWTRTSKHEAKAVGDYTFDPETEAYYIYKKGE